MDQCALFSLFRQIIFVSPETKMEDHTMKKVGILMGSDSDLPVVKKAADTLASFGVP